MNGWERLAALVGFLLSNLLGRVRRLMTPTKDSRKEVDDAVKKAVDTGDTSDLNSLTNEVRKPR